LLLFIIPLSLFGQVESQFNGTLNVFSASRIGFTNTFTISGIFTSTTTSYTSANSAVGDIVQVQSGSRFYWLHIYSIASNSGGVITGNVRDSSSTLTTFPTGKWSIFRPTPNLRLPLSPDGETNASRSATFNTLALRVDEIQTSVASATNCEITLTKNNHGFSKWTPLYWTGSTFVRPTYDTLVPDYIVVDSLTANTFKVATCGTYATILADGIYWYTNQSPGYSLNQDTTKAPLFQVIDSTLILNPIVGFNLMSGSGGTGITDGDKGDITVSGGTWTIDNGVINNAKLATNAVDSTKAANLSPNDLAQTGASTGQVLTWTGSKYAPRDLDGNGIISALPTGDVIIQSSNDLYIKDGSTGFHKTSYKTSTGATGTEIYRGGIIINKTATSDFGASYNINDTTGVVDFTYATTQDDRGVIQNEGSGPQITNLLVSTKLPGTYRWPYGVRVDTSSTISVIRQMYGDRYAGPTTPNVHHFRGAVTTSSNAYTAPFRLETNSASGKLSADIDGSLFVRENGKVYIGQDSSFVHDPVNDTTSAKGIFRTDQLLVRDTIIRTEYSAPYRFLYLKSGLRIGNRGDGISSIDFYGSNYYSQTSAFSIAQFSPTELQFCANGCSAAILRLYTNGDFVFNNLRYQSNNLSLTASNQIRIHNLYDLPKIAPSGVAGAISSPTWTAGIPGFLRSQHKTISGTTDGSGDITITFDAAMPDATYTLLATVEGTTSYTISVHTKATGSFKVRFFNPATGAAVTATSVTISYEAKDY